jgi:hypothetical protein
MTTHERDDEALDLTALRPLQLDSARHASLAARIQAAAVPGLTRRAVRPGSPWEMLAGSARPVLLAAAAALVLAVGLGRRAAGSAEADGDVVAAGVLTTSSIADALPARAADATWIAEQSAPTDADLARAIGLEDTGNGGNP